MQGIWVATQINLTSAKWIIRGFQLISLQLTTFFGMATQLQRQVTSWCRSLRRMGKQVLFATAKYLLPVNSGSQMQVCFQELSIQHFSNLKENQAFPAAIPNSVCLALLPLHHTMHTLTATQSFLVGLQSCGVVSDWLRLFFQEWETTRTFK